MTRFSFTLLSFLVSLHASGALAANPWDIKTPFKNAVITYEVSGTGSGEEKLYVRKWGKETVRMVKTTAKILFMTQTTDTITITTPQRVTEIDREEKSGTSRVNPVVYMRAEYKNLSAAEKKQVMKNAREMGTSLGGTFSPNAQKIRGYMCDKTRVLGSTIWNIHNSSVMLKTESSIMGITTNIQVTSLETSAPPAAVFSPPEGVTIVPATEEEEQASKDAAKLTIDWLKNPESAKQVESMRKHAQEDQERQEEEEGGEGEGKAMEDTIQKGVDALKDLW